MDRAEVKETYDQYLRMLTVEHAELLPWTAHLAVSRQLQEGGLPKKDPEQAAAMLLGQAQWAVVSCVSNPEGAKQSIAIIGQTLKEPLKTAARPLFEAIAAGANEIGHDESGQQLLTLKAMPAAIDGFQKFHKQPLELARHIAMWFILALAGGTGTERLNLDHGRLVQQVLPPMVFGDS